MVGSCESSRPLFRLLFLLEYILLLSCSVWLSVLASPLPYKYLKLNLALTLVFIILNLAYICHIVKRYFLVIL